MAAETNWEERGQRAVGSATDLATGIYRGFKNIGGRIKTTRHRPVVEAFCAYTGRIAAENGRLKQSEIDGFRAFLIQSRNHPVLGHFPVDELVEKFKQYAIKAFLEDDDVFITALDPISIGSDESQLIVSGCLAVSLADGDCDPGELKLLNDLCSRLQVNILSVAQILGVILPSTDNQSLSTHPLNANVSGSQSPPINISPPETNARRSSPLYSNDQSTSINEPRVSNIPHSSMATGKTTCSLCQGKGCVFCKNTGYK